MAADTRIGSGPGEGSAVARKPDRSAGDITEFPVSRAAPTPAPEDDDYLAEIFDTPSGSVSTRQVGGAVAWARTDRLSPCYSHLLVDGGDTLAVDKTFQIGKAEFELLIAANRYVPRGKNDIIVFGLRGARLRGVEKLENADRLLLEDARPDHKNFRCVIGYYFRATGKFSAFTGSTVPWHGYMSGGQRNNLLPTGCYIYKKGVHRPLTESRWVDPAFRLSDADGAESGPATVLRTQRDQVFDLTDEWDYCAPSDNIHCAYSNDKFSSLGCQTVKGGLHDGLWAIFQATIKSLPASARVDYVLVTGAECSIAAKFVGAGVLVTDLAVQTRLGRLRVGSEGENVKRLQARLREPETGYLGASTKKKLTDFQAANGMAADGIFSPELDRKLGWGVFSTSPAAEPKFDMIAATEPQSAASALPQPAADAGPEVAPASAITTAVVTGAEAVTRALPQQRDAPAGHPGRPSGWSAKWWVWLGLLVLVLAAAAILGRRFI